MPFDLIPLEDAIQDWFRQAIGLAGTNVIWLNQGGERPALPYATLNVTTPGTRLGGEDETRRRASPDTIVDIIAQRTMVVSLNTYGDQAINRMLDAQVSLTKVVFIDALELAGIAIVDQGEVQDLTEAVEENFLARAQLDVMFGYGILDTEDQSSIDRVIVNGETLDPNP